jgi:hypothetical protein
MMALAVQEGEGRERGPRLDLVSVLMDVERGLRELASDLQLRWGVGREVRSEDVSKIRKAAASIRNLSIEKGSYIDAMEKASEVMERVGRASKDDVRRLAHALGFVTLAIERAGRAAEYCVGTEPSDPYCVEMVRSRVEALEVMEDVMRAVERLTGRKCGMAAREQALRMRYDLPNFLNDISNCVHVLAEWVASSGLPTELERRGERCYVERDADGDLADLCAEWDRRVREKLGFYEDDDIRRLIGMVGRGEATFRVGSSPGHAARVRSDGTLVYYDTDKPVLISVHYLMRSLGYSCTATWEGEKREYTITCTPPRRDALRNRKTRSRLADVLSWVTSADIRIKRSRELDCRNYCEGKGTDDEEEDYEDFEECLDNCLDEYRDDDDWRFDSILVENADVEPSYDIILELREFGIRWDRTRRGRARPSA